MSRPTFMTIDLNALQHNLKRIHEFAPQSKIIAMVKANAYGHGITRVAQALATVDALGVASLEEALILREAGITQPIVLMEGVFSAEELIDVERQQLTLVVHHEPHLQMLERTLADKPIPVWLKINTGMNRLGIAPEQTRDFYQRLQACQSVKQPIGLMTHFAAADTQHGDATQQQLALFANVTHDLAGPRSLANSAAIINFPAAQADWVRPGLLLYGASPIAGQTGVDLGLKPVMTLSSRLIAMSPVKQGERIGYGGDWVAPNDMMVGIVGVGYGDGYPQCATSGTPVLVNKQECHTVGRVSMDMLAVELQQQPNAQIGDPVILWGKGLPVERVAKHSNTSAYEILTRMSPRPKIDLRELEEAKSVGETSI